MPLYDYQTKLKESGSLIPRRILEHVYNDFFPFLERIEYSCDEKFQRSGRDLTIYFKKPGQQMASMHIEEKIRSKRCAHYQDVLIEYLSNSEHRTLGWGFTSEAVWLSYVQNGYPDFLNVFLLPMQPLKIWFMARYDEYADAEARTIVGNRHYTTLNKVIPFEDTAFRIFCVSHGVKVKKLNADEIQEIEAGVPKWSS